MRKLCFLFLIPALLLPATLLPAQSPHQRLANSTIAYNFDTPPRPLGALHYRITILPNHTATIRYIIGGGSSTSLDEPTRTVPLLPSTPTTHTFHLSPTAYQTLLDTLLTQGILSHWPRHNPIPIGGPQELITLQRPHHQLIAITHPAPLSVSGAAPSARFEAIASALRSAIPESTWLAIQSEQDAHDRTPNP